MNFDTFIRLAKSLTSDPTAFRYQIIEKFLPSSLWQRYDQHCLDKGIKELDFVLSFDCDTPTDYKIVNKVHDRLTSIGARPVYAVPGALLEEGEQQYHELAASGAEFINHGGRSHTWFNEKQDRYDSCFFYDEQSKEDLIEDIRFGDSCVRNVLGQVPLGFRTPHFGSFQKQDELRFLHDVLREMGYRFSSSTTPYWAYKYGPVFSLFGLPEFPVTGTWSHPLGILDTWRYFAAPDRNRFEDDFEREAGHLVEMFANRRRGILNIYGDPSHIDGSDIFFDAVSRIVEIARPAHFSDLAGLG